MDLKKLMAGIAVVIDDKLNLGSASAVDLGADEDRIQRIVRWFEREWNLSFVKLVSLPVKEQWSNLLETASFVLLDWRLWGSGGDELKQRTIKEIVQFLKSARESLVPVFIFTNEDKKDVVEALPSEVYEEPSSGGSFVFVGRKGELCSGMSVDVEKMGVWVHGNASVYVLRTWQQLLCSARSEIFRRMRDNSVDWPRVFWESYISDGTDPSASLTSLINDSLIGRMRQDGFKNEHLKSRNGNVTREELRQLIAEASFRPNNLLPKDEVRSGDLYICESKKYLLNVRQDCDCVPRNKCGVDGVEVYCIQGKRLEHCKLRKLFNNGHFQERVSQSVVFAVVEGNSILFEFKDLLVMKFGEVKKNRVGRLLHPYVTRVQQRYTSYAQRQAIPRIPNGAV